MPHTLAPTHTCFDDALDDLAKLVGAGVTSDDGLRLVHGILLHPATDARYAHAWVEYPDHPDGAVQCLFQLLADGVRTHFITEREEYYREMRVQETLKYTVEEATEQNMATNSYGPWTPEYIALCLDREELDELIKQWGATTPYKLSDFEARRGEYIRFLRSQTGTVAELDKLVRQLGPRAVENLERLKRQLELETPARGGLIQAHQRYRLRNGRLERLP